jgi:soluble lytic murein transglycosylase-like protein
MEGCSDSIMLIGIGALGVASSLTKSQVQSMIVASAQAQGVNPALALAIAAHESGFNTNAKNCGNSNGTCDAGVMQINQTNWTNLGLSDPYDPQANIDAGVKMIGQLSTQFGGNEAQVLCGYQYGPSKCGNPNALPSLTPGFVSYVDNWIAANAPDMGTSTSSSTPAETPDTSSAGSWFDSTVSLLGYDVPMSSVLLVGGVAAFALWLTFR